MTSTMIRVLLVSLLLLHSALSYRSRWYPIRRRCSFCPKPLEVSVDVVQDATHALVKSMSVDPDLPIPDLDDISKMSDADIARRIMAIFSNVRCYALVKDIFTLHDIQQINAIELGLTEINRSPKVCIFDNFVTDCSKVGKNNVNKLYEGLMKLKVLLDQLKANNDKSN
eukprot:sb/3472301/